MEQITPDARIPASLAGGASSKETNVKALRMTRTSLAVTGAAAALTLALSGCGGGGDDSGDGQDQQSQAAEESNGNASDGSSGDQASDDASDDSGSSQQGASDAGSDSGSGAGTGGGTSEPAPRKSTDLYPNAAKTTSWASDDGMKVDKKGKGTISKGSLEVDLVDLFKNKFGMKVTKANCNRDMPVEKWRGYALCDVTTNKTKYFGNIKLIDHKGDMVKYEIKFPGIDKKDMNLNK